MICSACEDHRHYECIDCLSDHSTYKCRCECHDENTPPHSVQAHVQDGGKEQGTGGMDGGEPRAAGSH